MTEHSFDVSGEFGGVNGKPPTPVVAVEQPVTAITEPPVVVSEPVLTEEDLFTFTGVEKPDSLPLPRVDPVRGVFITSRRDEIQLSDKPVSGLIYERLLKEGKPKIPMVEVTLVGGRKQLEPHPGHEGYLALLEEWQEQAYLRMIKYLFTVGVKGQPPQSFVDEHLAFFPGSSEPDLKYLWVCSFVPDDDIEPLTQAIMGKSIPTAEGLQESADSFRHKG